MIHQLKAPLRGRIHIGANPMQHPRQNARKLFRLLESGASLGRAEDEVMMAGEKPWHTQEASLPMEMLIWHECLESGLESHAFWISVRIERLFIDW